MHSTPTKVSFFCSLVFFYAGKRVQSLSQHVTDKRTGCIDYLSPVRLMACTFPYHLHNVPLEGPRYAVKHLQKKKRKG